ncbi:MAG: hypothetical protein Q8R70_04310 [Methanoregula sp.]|nr:hypothetical protein [Methanoregula sp.]
MKDDAVAPVVAAMLVLAVIVTFFSVWNAVYLPSLKQQSEMTQLREVEGAFTRFSSDLTNAAALKRDLTMSAPFPLGGGGIILNPLLSAGTIRVNEEPKELYNLTITDGGIDHRVHGRMVNFSYQPVNDFWVDQGYVWHYGYVNVTKGTSPLGADGAALSTPLSYANMDDVKKSGTIRKFAASLIETESRPWNNSTANCSHITVSSVTFHPEPGASYVSSNGIGTFALSSSVNETAYGVFETTSPGAVVVNVNRVAPEFFPLALYVQCNQSFADLASKYPGNIRHSFLSTPEYKMSMIEPVAGSLPFDVTYQQIAINVSVR